MSVSRSYRGVTADERRSRRRAALLEAALDLLGSDDGDIGVRAVCTQARLTQRYFYESFASLDELELALFTEIASEVARQGAAAVRGAAPTDLFVACRTAFEGAYSVFQQDPRKARAATIVSANTQGLMEVRRTIVTSYTEAMRSFLGPTLGQTVDSARGRLTLLYAVGGALEVTQGVLSGEVDLTHSELCDAVGHLLAASVQQLLDRRPD